VEGAEIGGQFLRPQAHPAGVRGTGLRGLALRLGEHPAIRIDADDLGEEVGELQRDRARPAADIDQPACAIQFERGGDPLREPRGVRQPPAQVVRRGAGE
jgi:hypothetical protein